MKNIVCVMTFIFCVAQGLFAQEIQVKRFAESQEINWIPTQRVDANGVACALVRVVIPSNEGVLFQRNVIGETVYKGNEYLVYMSEYSRFLRVHYPSCETLMVDFTQYGYEGLESKRVYELLLTLPSELTKSMLSIQDTGASYDLGVHFLNNKNYDRAIHWFKLVAKEGNVDAQNYLGLCYLHKGDYNQAIHWFGQAEKAGHVGAQNNLGLCYRDMKDYDQAFHWFSLAAQAGNMHAQYNLAWHYLANKDYEQAVSWFEKAALQNHTEAQCDLGIHYYNNKDYTNAVSWFQKSANGGNKKAMEMLSVCYRNGQGVVQDISLAEEWADKANRK